MTNATAARDCLLSSCLATLQDYFLCPLSAQGCLEAFLVIPSVPSGAAPPLPLITDMLLCERLLVTIKVPCDIGMRGFAPVIRHLDTHHTLHCDTL